MFTPVEIMLIHNIEKIISFVSESVWILFFKLSIKSIMHLTFYIEKLLNIFP